MQFELAPFALPNGYAESILPLADLKEHLGVLEDDQNALIGLYRDAAIDMVERYCGVRLGALTGLVWRGEELPSPLALGVWPVTAITAISWLDESGNSVTGTAADWRIVRRDIIALKPGRILPTNVGGGVEVTFNAGLTDAQRPEALVQAARLFAGHLFVNREAVVGGTIAGEVPLGFRQLCGAYRVPVI
ncbi:phage head-tail connector protein [Erythrobacter sp. NE805]|uniref:head-tail connector protein n=1 Tax=Erythrobacter sp. NE805 TaxID=3389875 RepID=UPI00396B31C0